MLLNAASLVAHFFCFGGARGVRQQGACRLKTHIWSGLSALIHFDLISWSVAPGWYAAAPSAL
jgi:hypothetical protein